MSFRKIMLLRLRNGSSIGLHPMYLLLMVVLLVVVLLHHIYIPSTNTHVVPPPLFNPHGVLFEVEEELPGGENGEVEESSRI
jgi:hypothetical protein